MRAARFHGKEDIRFDELEEPTPGLDQVKFVAGMRESADLICICTTARNPRELMGTLPTG